MLSAVGKTSAAVSAVKKPSVRIVKPRKRKDAVNPPFVWSKHPGMELAFANMIRENADRLLTHTSDTTPIYIDMGVRLMARFETKAFEGPTGIERLRQKYKNMRTVTGAHVRHQNTSGNEKYALPHVYWPSDWT